MLDGTVMGDAIAEAIIDAGASAEGKAMCKDFWEKVGKAIVEHITTNAQVNSGIPVSTTGSAAAQTGSTTGAGTIS